MAVSTRKRRLRNLQYSTPNKLEARIKLHRLYGNTQESFHAWAGKLLPIPKPVQVLEVGCGTGAFWTENLGRLPGGSTVILSDFSPAMVEHCCHTFCGTRVRFVVADVEDLPFPRSCFDVINAHHILYHTDDRDQALSEIRRTLRSNGYASITTNSTRHMKVIFEIARRVDSRYPPERHIDSFTEEKADVVLAKHFRVIKKHVHENLLRVTDTQVLVDYLASTLDTNSTGLARDFCERYAQTVSHLVAQHGHLPIVSRSVLYICHP